MGTEQSKSAPATPAQNLASAEGLIREIMESKDMSPDARYENLKSVCDMILGRDSEEAPGAMNAEGAADILEDALKLIDDISTELSEANQTAAKVYLGSAHARIDEVRAAKANVRSIQTAVRRSSGAFSAFKQAS